MNSADADFIDDTLNVVKNSRHRKPIGFAWLIPV